MSARALALAVLVAAAAGAQPAPRPDYPWPHPSAGGTLAQRFPPPPGFARLAAPPRSFAAWLRGLPLLSGRPDVKLFDGRPKVNQSAHAAVIAIDVGRRDLQQCADAVMRLYAEYLFTVGCDESIAFRFTSGDRAAWTAYRDGVRPRVSGSNVSWSRAAGKDATYASFRRYLDLVFTYAGSLSLSKELETVPDPAKVEAGDVFIQGGSPGHAVLVADVAEDRAGRRALLLLQSYMPAQEIHVLRNPMDAASPWYRAASSGPLPTPEWSFRHEDLRRFKAPRCTH